MASKETVNRYIMMAIMAVLIIVLILAARMGGGSKEDPTSGLGSGIVRLGDVPVGDMPSPFFLPWVNASETTLRHWTHGLSALETASCCHPLCVVPQQWPPPISLLASFLLSSAW